MCNINTSMYGMEIAIYHLLMVIYVSLNESVQIYLLAANNSCIERQFTIIIMIDWKWP
jgi:hypothetical protein